MIKFIDQCIVASKQTDFLDRRPWEMLVFFVSVIAHWDFRQSVVARFSLCSRKWISLTFLHSYMERVDFHYFLFTFCQHGLLLFSSRPLAYAVYIFCIGPWISWLYFLSLTGIFNFTHAGITSFWLIRRICVSYAYKWRIRLLCEKLVE